MGQFNFGFWIADFGLESKIRLEKFRCLRQAACASTAEAAAPTFVFDTLRERKIQNLKFLLPHHPITPSPLSPSSPHHPITLVTPSPHLPSAPLGGKMILLRELKI